MSGRHHAALPGQAEQSKNEASRRHNGQVSKFTKINHFHGCRVELETEEERSLGATGTLEMQASESLQVQNSLEARQRINAGTESC